MSIEAKVIEWSIGPEGQELITMQLKYQRFIHAEFMTHRMFSRNASSSRAIPVNKMIDNILNDPAIPVAWKRNIPGMQGGDPLSKDDAEACRMLWIAQCRNTVKTVRNMVGLGLAKEVANRMLEPWQHIHVVCTGTRAAYNNFFWLRDHEDAQPEIQALARAMKAAQAWNTEEKNIRLLGLNEWHLPYILPVERSEFPVDLLRKLSVARCARVSYLKHDNSAPSVADDLALYERLINRDQIHASPAEHIATPDNMFGTEDKFWGNPHLHGNIEGWIQYRKTLPNEFKGE